MRLLWVDDDQELLQAGIPAFERHGFDVISTTTVTRALTLLRREAKNLDGLLLDVKLGGEENGLELLKNICHNYPDLKIVILTAYPDYIDHIDAMESGAALYVQKFNKNIPLDPREQKAFFESLRRAFEGRSKPKAEMASLKIGNGALWNSGAFFLLVFAVVVAGMILLSNYVLSWLLPFVLLAAILFYATVGAFILRSSGDGNLSEVSFVELMKEVLRYLPQLRFPRARMRNGQSSVEKNLASSSREE